MPGLVNPGACCGVLGLRGSNPVETEANISLTREFFAAMRPYLADAAYVNYFSDVEDDALRAAYDRNITGCCAEGQV